jgi:hypothetical protein
LNEHEKRLVIHGMLAAVQSLCRINTPVLSMGELAGRMANYADALAKAWEVKPDTRSLEELIREIEKVPIPDFTDTPDVARWPENNN